MLHVTYRYLEYSILQSDNLEFNIPIYKLNNFIYLFIVRILLDKNFKFFKIFIKELI